MDQGPTGRTVPTRHACLRDGGALLAGNPLTGCTGRNDAEPSVDATGAVTMTAADGNATGYTVSISLAGGVTFESVPGNVTAYNLVYVDAAVASGHGGAVNSLGFDSDVDSRTLDIYYERLDGVSFDRGDPAQLNPRSESVSIDEELVYKLDSGFHFVDPALVVSFDGWSQSGVEGIHEQVAPWFGNAYSRTHARPPEPYADDCRYYTLWEIVESVGQASRGENRYTVLGTIYSGFLDTIRSDSPPESERPSVGIVIYIDKAFYPTEIDTPGLATSHIRPFGTTDAFAAGDVTFEASYDLETVLEIDPGVLLHSYGISSCYDVTLIRKALENHPVRGELSAIRNDRVYPSGVLARGPIMSLFQTEMTMKQLYPDRFGAWPTYDDGACPVIPEGERLFDRKRVTGVVTGD